MKQTGEEQESSAVSATLPERIRPSSPRLFTAGEPDTTMGYLNSSSSDARQNRGAIYRRVTLLLLMISIHYLIYVDWKPQRNWSPDGTSIRGSVGIKKVGSLCEVDGREDRIKTRHAIVFDAGSTGSRVHVYEFQFCGARLEVLVDEVFEEVKPGLSHYHGDPLQAAKSLKPLLDSAVARVPPNTRKCTPLVVKATAGLRLLPEHSVAGILTNVREFIRTHPFLLGDGKISHNEAVAVMDGSEEGVFAWVTVNFLQDKLRPGFMPTPFLPDETSVVMDLGGGSTQIVFAISREGMEIDPLSHPQYYYRLSLYGKQVDLYQQSYLGYGLMEARKNIKGTHIQKMLADSSDGRALRFACYTKGYKEEVDKNGKTFILTGDSSGWDSCLNVVRPIFRKDDPCTVHPCSFNGIHQPAIRSKNLITFSYFFDRLIPLGLTSPVTLFDIDREGRKLCQPIPGGRYEKLMTENPQWCLDLAYIYSLLRIGYQVDFDQPIVVTKQINGYEAGWSLGAALKLLEAAPDCEEKL
jgi:guanosine-diphosphatase